MNTISITPVLQTPFTRDPNSTACYAILIDERCPGYTIQRYRAVRSSCISRVFRGQVERVVVIDSPVSGSMQALSAAAAASTSSASVPAISLPCRPDDNARNHLLHISKYLIGGWPLCNHRRCLTPRSRSPIDLAVRDPLCTPLLDAHKAQLATAGTLRSALEVAG